MENYKKIPEYWDIMGHITASDCPEKQYNGYKKVFDAEVDDDDEDGFCFTLRDFELYIKELGYNEEIEDLEENKLYATEIKEVGFLINSKKDWQYLYNQEIEYKNKKQYMDFFEVLPFNRTDLLDEMLDELVDAGIVIQEGPSQDLYIDAKYLKKTKQ